VNQRTENRTGASVRFVLRAAIIVLFAPVPALANEDEPVAMITPSLRMAYQGDSDALFDMLDTDASQSIDRNEAAFDIELRKQFNQADSNTDNEVSRGEYSDFHSQALGDDR